MPQGRNAEGKWKPGTSGNPGGISAEELEKITAARQACQSLTPKAVKTLDRLMDDENGKVAATASLGVLKAAGVFDVEPRIQREVEKRLQELLDAAQNDAPKLTSVG